MPTRLAAAFALLTLPAAAGAQTLAQRAETLGDGTLRLSFAARAGVCGNGGHNITIVSHDEDDEWESDCTPGPVRVSLRVRGGRVAEAHTYVGGRWRPPEGKTADLGQLPARQAAADLLALVEQQRADAEELVTAATLADSAVVWPVLLRIARRPELPVETRRQARRRRAGSIRSRTTAARRSRCGNRRCSRCRSGRRMKACRC